MDQPVYCTASDLTASSSAPTSAPCSVCTATTAPLWLADLRRIYDGHLRRELGTAEHPTEREWRGRLTFLVAATPDVDRHYSIFQTLGERFVMVRWHRPGGTEAALRAMGQNRQRVRQELRNAVSALFDSLPEQQPALPEALERRIAALAEFVVVARTHVARDGRTKEILYIPEPEASTRLAQQLCQLAKGSALLARRETVTDEDVAIVQRAGMDCIPTTRRKIIEVLMRGKHRSSIMLGSALKMAWSTYSYAKADLASLGLVDSSFDHEEGETVQWLTREAKRLLREAGIRTRRGRVVKGGFGGFGRLNSLSARGRKRLFACFDAGMAFRETFGCELLHTPEHVGVGPIAVFGERLFELGGIAEISYTTSRWTSPYTLGCAP